MIPDNTDHHWQRWGQNDPYYGVLTRPEFSKTNLDAESRHEFFETGERHVSHVFEVIHSRIQPDFAPERILDFGCGPARLVIPFCRRAKFVVGVDVSRPMLEEARKNCDIHGVGSPEFLRSDQLASLPASSFDLVHTFIVLQHIPPRRGEKLVRSLVDLLKDGGIGAIHLTYSHNGNAVRHLLNVWRSYSGLLNGVLNVITGRPYNRPTMMMNHYSLNRIFDMLLRAGCSKLSVEFSSDPAGCNGVMLYFEKTPTPLLAQ
jgi:SAM-dependent methyltransferase